MEFVQYIPAIISALATIITAWFAYNQYSKNKMTDIKIEKFRKEEEIRSKRRSDNSAIVYGELWTLLHELQADRVYIVQPHPLGNEDFLSIYFEVKRKGVEPMKPHIQNLAIADVAKFSSEMVSNLFMYVSNIEDHDWVGSIFCEFTRSMDISETDARKVMHEAATNIQYILPEFK